MLHTAKYFSKLLKTHCIKHVSNIIVFFLLLHVFVEILIINFLSKKK